MNSKTLIVYESQILFEILDEIKEYLNLEIINSSEKDFKNINFENFDNRYCRIYWFLSSTKIAG